MAAAFVAMNEVYGPLFEVSRAEAQDKDRADARAKAFASQFVMDTHTHFLRDDTKILTFVRQREAVGKQGWNPGLVEKPQTIEDLKFRMASGNQAIDGIVWRPVISDPTAARTGSIRPPACRPPRRSPGRRRSPRRPGAA